MKSNTLKLNAAVIAVVYVAISFAWIMLSDQIAAALFRDPEVLTVVQSVKGLSFVFLSGILIYLMTRKSQSRMERKAVTRESAEARVVQLFEDSVDAELLVDPATDTCHAANGAAALLLGQSKEDLKGRKLSDFVAVDSTGDQSARQRVARDFAAAMRGDADPVTWRLRAQDDTEVVCDVTLTVVALDGETLIRVHLNDVTEKHDVEQILSLLGEGLTASVGVNFLETLTANLTRVLKVDYAMVAMIDSEDHNIVRTVAFSHDGETIDELRFPVAGTPTESVIEAKSQVIVPSGVCDVFPKANFIKSQNIEGFAGTPLFDSSGVSLGVIGVLSRQPLENDGLVSRILDIAAGRAAAELERLRIESALRLNEIRFRSMIDEASQGIIVHDKLRPIYVNTAFATMFGYSNKEEVLALENIAPLFDSSEYERLQNYNKVRMAGGNAPTSYQFLGRRADGSVFNVDNRVVRVPWGDRMVTCANMFDITEQAGMKQALERSEVAFRGLVEGSVQGILIASGNRLLFANGAAARMFGYESVSEILAGGLPEALFPNNFRSGLLSFDAAKADENETVIPSEIECRSREGKKLWVNLMANDIEWRGKKAVQITLQDTTSEKESEVALRRSQRMEAVGQLTGGIAHDFNNLLGIILGNLEFLSSRLEPGKPEARFVDNALQATNRGAQLTRRLLGFSSETSEIKSATDINETLTGLEDILTRSLTMEIEIDFVPAPDLWKTEIDPGDFSDAIVNLALNARDAMPGGGSLVIKTGNETLTTVPAATGDLAPGDYVTVSVTDTGCGIPRDSLEKIFEPFFSTKHRSKGTGLGLSMVYGFVKRSAGGIRVSSKIDVGSTFTIYLPRYEEHVVENEVKARKPLGPLPCGTETILVVDDEQYLREIVCEQLSTIGYTTLDAPDGRTALKVLEDNPEISLLLSDVIMPGGMNGFVLAEKAVALYPELDVLLASGFTGRLTTEIERNGCPDYRLLAKPYNLHQLACTVREVLDHTGPSGNAAPGAGKRTSETGASS